MFILYIFIFLFIQVKVCMAWLVYIINVQNILFKSVTIKLMEMHSFIITH